MIEENKIYHGDCIEIMQHIGDKQIDCIICDLPYGCLHRNNPHAQWDRVIPFQPLWKEYTRIIKDNGAIILFSQGMFTAQLMLSNPKLFRYSLVWDKQRVTGFLNANRMPMRVHEDICVFYKRLPTYHPQYTTGQPNHSTGNGTHKHTNQCYGAFKTSQTYEKVKHVQTTVPDNMKLPRSIISIRKEKLVSHPTQKPVELIRYLIRTYTNAGDVVLDNCIGSGTTAVAAIKEQRRFIGIELNKEYFDFARKRVDDELNKSNPD